MIRWQVHISLWMRKWTIKSTYVCMYIFIISRKYLWTISLDDQYSRFYKRKPATKASYQALRQNWTKTPTWGMRVERYLPPFKPVQTQTCWLPMAANDEHCSSTAIPSTSTLLLFGNVTLKTVKVLVTQKNRRRTFAEGWYIMWTLQMFLLHLSIPT